MKKYLIAFLLMASAAFASEVTFVFDGNNPPGTVDYVLEVKRSTDPSAEFEEVESIPAGLQPGYSEARMAEFTLGRYTVRVRARAKNDPTLFSGPSNEVSVVVTPNSPARFTVKLP